MENNRLDILKQLVDQNPKDAFAHYGLGMEYAKAGSLAEAAGEFQAVLSINPGYLYAYFHGGQTREKMHDLDGAREMYEAGIEQATRLGDAKALAELRGALELLPL